MKNYTATIPVDNPLEGYHRAPILAEQYGARIQALGGMIDFNLHPSGTFDTLLLSLPDDILPVLVFNDIFLHFEEASSE